MAAILIGVFGIFTSEIWPTEANVPKNIPRDKRYKLYPPSFQIESTSSSPGPLQIDVLIEVLLLLEVTKCSTLYDSKAVREMDS